ncbi:hypothetical protein DID77_02515 [Candidatus Marinamargulisbacteria bacterium SCGC AG-439-L15]|nr:hypothetical protein DID77_02515 [Candidatus Marinamargulisbacteria bacterium SCGC AG-439-L15]
MAPQTRTITKRKVPLLPDWAEYSSDFIGFLDSGGHILEINKTVGPPKETVLGKPYMDFVVPEYRDRVSQVFQDVLDSKEARLLSYGISHEGIKKQLSVHFIPILDELKAITYIQFIAVESKIDKTYLQSIESLSKIGLWSYYPETNLLHVTDGFSRMIGLERQAPTITLTELEMVLHSEDKDIIRLAFNQTLEEKKSSEVIFRVFHTQKDKFVYILQRIELVLDEGGNIVYLFGVNIDITEKHERELDLKLTQDRLTEAQLVARLGGWSWTVSTNKVWFSPECYHVYGLDPGLAVLENIDSIDLVFVDDRPKVLMEFDAAVREKRDLSLEHRAVNPVTQKVLHLACYAKVVLDASGQVSKFVGYIQDISRRKEAEAALLNSEKRLKRAQKIARMGSFEYNVRSEELLCSDHLYALFGLEKTSYPLKLETLLDMVHEDDREGMICQIQNSIDEKKDLYHKHRFYSKKDAKLYTFEVFGELIRDKLGAVLKIMGTFQDITEKEELKETLESTLQELESSLEKKELLLQEVHHRVKNNLQIISSLLNISAHMSHKDASEVLSLFKPFQNRIQAMSLVHQNLYRSDMDQVSFLHYINDLSGYLGASFNTKESNVQFKIDIPKTIYFDMDMTHYLGLIVNELITNALQHAFPDQTSGEIRISCNDEGARYCLMIQDTGVGVSDSVNYTDPETFGFKMVQLFSKQIKAELEISKDQGTCVILYLNKKELSIQS